MLPVAVSIAVALCGSTAAAAAAPAGVRGTVMRGPVTPVCTAGVPCDAPARGLVLVFARKGVVLARATTDARGRYTVRLRPGVYGISTVRRGLGSSLTPRLVRVLPGKVTRLDLRLDTGIR